MSKKLLTLSGVVLFVSFIIGIVFLASSPVFAQTPPGGARPQFDSPNIGSSGSFGNPKVKETEEAVKLNLTSGSQSQENSEVNTTENVQVSLIWGLIGGRPTLGANNQVSYSKGLVGGASDMVVAMFVNPAANTSTYVADVLNSAGIVQPAYAQGLGFSSLDPILEVWKIFRNIAYFFFVVAFMVIGFMIMFRQKIGSQTVVTAQQAIPSIIIALLAVTFSYAIAGLIIDLMYIIMYLLVGLFGRNSAELMNGNFLQLGYIIIGGTIDEVGSAVSSYINDTLGGGILGGLAGIAGGVTAMLVFAVAIAIGVFRLFFNLLRRYVAIILTVALAPLILMVSALPGRNTFGGWLKGIIGNLAAFPILLLALIVSDVLTGTLSGSTRAIEYGGFLPPYIGGNGTAGAMSFIVGLGILLILSELIDKGAEMFGAGKGPFDALADAFFKHIKEGVPLGGRMAALGASAVPAAISGGVSLYRNRELPLSDRLNAAREASSKTFKNSAARSIDAVSYVSRSIGANQPDILNPVTSEIDRRFAPETGRREAVFNVVEDMFQRVQSSAGGLPSRLSNDSQGGSGKH